MDARQTDLWTKIRDFQFDDPGARYSFADRLQKENSWTSRQARQAIEEYRRFIFLAISAGHPVSPPDAVDQVWHLHLLYTRSYYDRLCAQTLGRVLHHEPTRGGVEESAKFADWYNKTLASYLNVFGEEAPRDLWPRNGESAAHDFRRIDIASTWIVPKFRAMQSAMILIVVIAILALAGGCDRVAEARPSNVIADVDNPFNYRGTDFIYFYLTVLGMAIFTAIALRMQAKYSVKPQSIPDDLDAYEVACLQGGPSRGTRAAIAGLVSRQFLSWDPAVVRFQALRGASHVSHPLEQAILESCERPTRLKDVEAAATPAMIDIEADLQQRHLILPRPARTMAGVGTFLIFAVLIAGIAKICVGVSRNRPVGILVMLCFVTFVIGVIFASRRVYRSAAGDKVIKNLKQRYDKASAPLAASNPAYAGMDGGSVMPMMFALYGAEMLMHDPATSSMRQYFGPQAGSSSGGSSCSSSDGGGGGGDGGGGGCGGCGGGD